MKAIGSAVFYNLQGYLNWYAGLDADQFEELSFFQHHYKVPCKEDDLACALEMCEREWFSSWRKSSFFCWKLP